MVENDNLDLLPVNQLLFYFIDNILSPLYNFHPKDVNIIRSINILLKLFCKFNNKLLIL